MVKPKYIAWGIAGTVALVFLVKYLLINEEDRVREQFTALSGIVSMTGEEELLTIAGKAKRLTSLFTDPCTLSTPYGDLSGAFTPSEVAGLVIQARSQCTTLTLSFKDVVITFPDSDTAQTTLTASIRAGNSGDGMNDVRELNCTLKKVEGEWLFNECSVVPVLQK